MKIHSVVNSVRFRRQAFVLEILLRANGFQLLRLLVIDKQFIVCRPSPSPRNE